MVSGCPPTITMPSRPSHGRLWTCIFQAYGCAVVSVSQSGWKRHIVSKHLHTSVYRCDVKGCNRVFDRRDAFVRHVYQTHQEKPLNHLGEGHRTSIFSSTIGHSPSADVRQERCLIHVREPPVLSSCGRCSRIFQGEDCWIQRERHLRNHEEPPSRTETEEDCHLLDWALREGLLVRTKRGNITLQDRKKSLVTWRASGIPTARLRKASPQLTKASDTRLSRLMACQGKKIEDTPRPQTQVLRQFVWVCVSATISPRHESNFQSC